MRLTCPNCAAQYEVPEDVIPAEGRDVQCSSCGQTWFQASASALAAASDAAAVADSLQATDDAEPVTEDVVEEAPEAEAEAEIEAETVAEDSAPQAPAEATPAPAPEPAPEPEDEDASETDSGSDSAPAEDPAPAPNEDAAQTRGRALDPALSDILREEAEREAALRAAERQSLETQPDLGLQEPQQPEQELEQDVVQRGREARDRMARMRGEDPRRLAAEESGSRRELLPDIEEINSTLRASGNPAATAANQHEQDQSAPPRKRSGFARGFALSLILGVLLVLAYSKAPMIAQTLPQAEPALSSYVAWVDQLRLWLDTQAQSLTAQ